MTRVEREGGGEARRAGGERAAALTGWRADALFAAFAAVLAVLFFRDFVFQPGRLLFGTDMLLEGYPLRGFALEEVRAGRGLPGWNPYLNAGHPFLATLPGPLFYPTSLLYLVLPLHRAIGWTFVLHAVLAGVFAYFCARSFRLSRPSAAVSGLAFMFTGYLLSTLYGGHDGRMFALALMPLALGLLERGMRSGGAGWFLGLGVVVACQIFTPHTQMMYFSSLGLVLYAAFRLWTLRGRHDPAAAARGKGRGARPPAGTRPTRWLRAGGLVVLAFAVAAALGAIQLLPTYLLLDHVVRAAVEEGYEFAASWALPPQEVTALFLPDLMGALETYWGTNPFKLHTEYLGAVPVALALFAVATSFGSPPEKGKGLDRRLVWFFAAVALVGILFALGAATPVHRIAYALVPMMDSFRAPSMMLGPVSVFVALLAGAGWERARGAGKPLPWLAIGALSAPFLLLGLAAALAPRGLLDFVYHSWLPAGWPRTPPPELEASLRISGAFLVLGWLAVLAAARGLEVRRIGEWVLVPLLLLLVWDLARVDARFLRTADAEAELAADETIRSLAAGIRPGERGWPLEGVYHPNELMRHGVPVLTGTQKFLLAGYDRLVGGVAQENLIRHPALWAMFDLRYLVARSALETPLLEPVQAPSPVVRVYEPALRLPHAFFPAAVRARGSPEEALRATLTISDPRAQAVVEAPEAPPAGAGSAELERWRADEIVLAVSAEREGLVFVSELWAPGWRAEVEGREIPILRTNVAFRGVQLPAGEYRVRLSYQAPGYRAGRAVTLLTLLLLAAAFGWIARTRARARVGDAR